MGFEVSGGKGAVVSVHLDRAVVNRSGVAIYVADMVYHGDCVRLDIDLLADGGRI